MIKLTPSALVRSPILINAETLCASRTFPAMEKGACVITLSASVELNASLSCARDAKFTYSRRASAFAAVRLLRMTRREEAGRSTALSLDVFDETKAPRGDGRSYSRGVRHSRAISSSRNRRAWFDDSKSEEQFGAAHSAGINSLSKLRATVVSFLWRTTVIDEPSSSRE